MDNLRSPLLNWPFYYQPKSLEELRHSMLYTTLELESTRLAAEEEIRKRESQITHLKNLLNVAIKERDEAQDKFHRLLLEKSGSITKAIIIEDEPTTKKEINNSNDNNNNNNNGLISYSDCEESTVSSPENDLRLLSGEKPLPEKGKLLQAVMKAGPLLQTLLLAGPLPQWRHPPPPLESFEIPPVTIPAPAPAEAISSPEFIRQEEFLTNCGVVNRKRGYLESDWDDSSSPEAIKYQRVLH